MKYKRVFALYTIMVLAILAVAGCRKPYMAPIFVEIQPHETAFVVPLEGQTSAQAEFGSLELLEEQMVATKRVEIAQTWVQTGRQTWMGHYIPNSKVITVTRSPVTREWTQSAQSGTTNKDDAFAAETSESIDFSYGGVVTARIKEGYDTALFLFEYSGVPLETIIDTNVRGFMQAELAMRFAVLNNVETRTEKGVVFAEVCELATEEFAESGITISACGPSGGLTYTDPKIQENITANFTAEQAKVRAQAELDAQVIDNERTIARAKAEATVVEVAGEAEANAIRAISEALTDEVTRYEIAQSYNGNVPTTFVGNDFPMGMFLEPTE